MGTGSTYLSEESVQEASLEDTETYKSRRYITVEEFIATRNILDLCLEAERRLEKMWWEQEGIDLTGVWGDVTAGRLEEA